MKCFLAQLDFSDWTALVAVGISALALWRTGRERVRSLLADSHRRASQIEHSVGEDVYAHLGFISFKRWSEEFESGYLECRRIYARTRRHLKGPDRRKLDDLISDINESTLNIQANTDDEEEVTDERLDWRASENARFIWVLCRALDRAAYGIKTRDLPPEDED